MSPGILGIGSGENHHRRIRHGLHDLEPREVGHVYIGNDEVNIVSSHVLHSLKTTLTHGIKNKERHLLHIAFKFFKSYGFIVDNNSGEFHCLGIERLTV